MQVQIPVATKLPYTCAGYPDLNNQSTKAKTKESNIVLQTFDKTFQSNFKQSSSFGWNEQPSYCFFLELDKPGKLSSVCLRNYKSPFVSIHAATLEQAKFYKQCVAASETKNQGQMLSSRADSKLVFPDNKLPVSTFKTFSNSIENARILSKTYAKTTGTTGASGVIHDGKLSITISDLLASWDTLVPLTQCFSVEQLVKQAPGKLETIRSWRVRPSLKIVDYSLVCVRCWAFYEWPKDFKDAITVGLKWVALYGFSN